VRNGTLGFRVSLFDPGECRELRDDENDGDGGAKSIAGDEIASEDIAARVHTLRPLLKQVRHDV
jgi:hypothetical protein